MPGWSPSCCCPTPTPTPPPCTTEICVNSCGGVYQPGALVTIFSGMVIVSSGTTDATGCVVLSIPMAGSYTVTVSLTGFVTYSGTLMLSCSGFQVISLTSVVTAACFCPPTLGSSANCPSWPYNTVTINDGQGAVVCTYGAAAPNGYGSAGFAGGCAMRLTQNSVSSQMWNGSSCNPLLSFAPISVPVWFAFICTVGNPSYQVVAVLPLCSLGGNWMSSASCTSPPITYPAYTDVDSAADMTSQALGGCGTGFSYIETHTFTAGSIGFLLYGPTVTFSVSTP